MTSKHEDWVYLRAGNMFGIRHARRPRTYLKRNDDNSYNIDRFWLSWSIPRIVRKDFRAEFRYVSTKEITKLWGIYAMRRYRLYGTTANFWQSINRHMNLAGYR